MTEVELLYGVRFGPGDASDEFSRETELEGEQEEAYLRAVMTGGSPDEIPELQELLENLRPEIEEIAVKELAEFGDEFVLQCLGEEEMYGDKITELVQVRDPYTLEYFGLEELSGEELDEWDADLELIVLPLEKDFREDFEPLNPFEEGYMLNLRFAEPEPPDDSDVLDYLEELLRDGDVDTADDVLDAQKDHFGGCLRAEAFLLAVETECLEYLRRHVSECRFPS